MSRLRGHHAVSALGAGVLVAALVHHGAEVGVVEGAVGPLLALALDGGIAVAVIAAGRRIAARELSPAEEWRVARWAGAGTVLAVVAFAATLAVRAFEGRPLVEPAFPMLVAAGAGSLGGAIAGYYAVRQAAEARRARDAVRAVSFVNHLLRHDLRNDLSTIRGYAGLLADDADGSDHAETVAAKADEGLDRIEATSAVADAILGDADASRVDLAETTRDVLSGVTDGERATIETEIPESAPVAANDGVRSVVSNLVENAIEHADPGVTVRVGVRVPSDDAANRRDDEVVLVVEDDGPGLPPEVRDGSFLADEAVGGASGGVSGLRLVATLAEAYGGSLDAGESPLGGARFAVTLPHAPVDSAGSDT